VAVAQVSPALRGEQSVAERHVSLSAGADLLRGANGASGSGRVQGFFHGRPRVAVHTPDPLFWERGSSLGDRLAQVSTSTAVVTPAVVWEAHSVLRPARTQRYRADPLHGGLGSDFFDVVTAAAFPKLELRYRNDRWAERVGLEDLDDGAWLNHLGGFEPLPDNFPHPLALRYHGHQFQTYNADLGDGRGFLYAQLRDTQDARLLDLGTKGSGQTPWSRGGDGRLTLKGGVREVLATAMLEALGVYTSKSFSLIETGEALMRNDEPSPTRSAVLVRLSHSHIRFGSFQRQAFLERADNVQKLVDYSVRHYFPDLADRSGEERTAAFLHRIVERSADLAASWMVAGFVHGVLNTDNMNITGESFDYGPYRFLPTLDPSFTAAYFDGTGLYAYGRQPEVVAWNLTRLAEALLTICEKEPLLESLKAYGFSFERSYQVRTLERLGLRRSAIAVSESDAELIDAVYRFLHESEVGFEQFFFDWYGGLAARERASRSPEADKYATERFTPVATLLERYTEARPGRLEVEYFRRDRPCTLLIDEIESLWSDIADRDDWSAFEAKLSQIEEMRRALA